MGRLDLCYRGRNGVGRPLGEEGWTCACSALWSCPEKGMDMPAWTGFHRREACGLLGGRRAEGVTGRLAGQRVTPWLGKNHSGGTGSRVWIVLVEVLR